MTYRCQGCRDYHRTVYRTLGLGSVCSPECEATVRARQRGGKGRDRNRHEGDRESYFIKPVPGTGDSTGSAHTAPGSGDSTTSETASGSGDRKNSAASGDAGDIAGKPHTGDSTNPASGDTDDSTILDLHQRDGTHDSTSRSSDHDSKKTPREETLATTVGCCSGTALSRDWKDRTLERDRRCRYCGTRRNLHVHHIDYKSQGGSNDLHNLTALCVEHHDLVHSNKRLWQPILRAYIWLLYIENRRHFLLDIKRIYGKESARHDNPVVLGGK